MDRAVHTFSTLRFTNPESSALTGMRRFLVGGAVRDMILGLEPIDRDFVVIGETPETMIAAGFRRVGGSTPDGFPVFLHPVTGEEHALARTERKTGEGTDGRGVFSFVADPTMTLEEDLARRDLTINAMAIPAGAAARVILGDDSAIIDPFNGQADLAAGVLRHVGPAFAEDSLRVLRVARFASRFGFVVAADTIAMCKRMASRLADLPAERIAGEILAGMAGDHPDRFVSVLRDVGALSVILPEVAALEGVPQPLAHHPEGDALAHTILALRIAATLSRSPIVKFMVLAHDVGKALTPQDVLPQHIGHDKAGVPLVEAMGKRLRMPKVFTEAAMIGAELHMKMHRAFDMKPGTIVKLFDSLRVKSDPGMDMLDRLLRLSEADVRGRAGHESDPFPSAAFMLNCAVAYRSVDGEAVTHLPPERRADRMRQLRVEAVKTVHKPDNPRPDKHG
jgi:tRNA nucleotidyltransferase (CCA-adding enzyme)